MTFEEWWEKPKVCGDCFEDVAKAAWDAATAEVKKDHFMIGEEVEIDILSKVRGRIYAIGTDNFSVRTDCPSDVRRIPELEPKDGEAVLFNDFGITKAGIYNNGCIESGMMCFSGADVKPWKRGKIGLPWELV